MMNGLRTPSALPNATQAMRDRISLGFLGDVCLSLDVINVVRRQGPEFLFESVKPLFEPLDLVVANLECCITDRGGDAAPQRPPLSVPADVAAALTGSGIDVFGLANNHVMDFGPDGLRSTMAFLDGHGFAHFGAGTNLAAAEAPRCLDVGGRRIALLGACDVTASWADRDKAGVAPLVRSRLLRRVADARPHADVVVVVLHADLEFTRHPAPWRQNLSRRLVDAGAALVIQHHPHVCQGIEHYRGGIIAYSLGNTVFHVANNDYQRHVGTDESMLLKTSIEFADETARIVKDVLPLKVDRDHRPVSCDREPAAEQLKRLEGQSLQLLDKRSIRSAWRRTCLRQLRAHLYGTYYTLRREGFGAAVRDQARFFRQKEDRRWLIGSLSAGYM